MAPSAATALTCSAHPAPGPGTLPQSFNSIAGQAYLLGFALSRNSNDNPNIGVSFNGGAQTQYIGGTGVAPNQYLVS